MKPIFEKNSEFKAVFTIDSEEKSGVYLFSNLGVKRIEPDYIYFEGSLARFDFQYIEDGETINNSFYIELDKFSDLKEMLNLAGYWLISSKEGFYYILGTYYH